MAKTHIQHMFNCPASELWALIGDFGDTGKWSGRPPEACVQTGEGIGALRTLTLADGRQIIDRPDAMGPMSYIYSIVEAPLPVASYTATMAVHPLDDESCEFRWSGTFEPKGISDEQAIAFFDDVYRSGLAMIEKSLAATQHK
jgi:Polyketide cyclase / dehydrase and lipid transport